MFNFRKKNKSVEKDQPASQNQAQPDTAHVPELQKTDEQNLNAGLEKSRSKFGSRLKSMFRLKRKLDDELFEELETLLLTADVGAEASMAIIDDLTQRVKRRELSDVETVYSALREQLNQLLQNSESPLQIPESKLPFVILVVGVNGVGKTTTIGKLAQHLQREGLSVMLAAGDTFRAAAVEQLKMWGERNQVPVVAQQSGSDSASVIFDAFSSAKAKQIDVLIADTAGRLHTQAGLMDELKKIKRVLGKIDPSAPHETLLVIDGGTGQNAISQAEQFHEAVKLTGIAVTKLDGTAKGGVLFALAKKLGLPFRFIGVGEKLNDLQVFKASSFVDALIPKNLE